ncbi:cache domain-containing protein [Leucobacter salsicius]|uniref:cache domain-containing protein n=1 Tax=Leucobacter salsicius TaxID=664638 RepID=UPI00034544D7|nr:cache domain-containing protein [Leucobacter salsicius]
MTENTAVQRVREQLEAWFHERLARVEALAGELLGGLRLDDAGYLDLSESVRRRLKTVAGRFLIANEFIDGCGLIVAHSALGTENGHLEWWVREDDARFARYSFGVVPGADRYYDYEQHEWFVRSFTDGESALVGPYIDYLGVESYVLTLTVPAVVSGKRVGAVGNDIQVQDLERALLPLLVEQEQPFALLSQSSNVLLSNSAGFLPGDLVTGQEPGYVRLQLEPKAMGLQLLYADAGMA